MKSHPYFLVDKRDIYHRILAEALVDEIEEAYPEINCGNITTIKDIFKADLIIFCGDGEYHRGLLWAISVFKKPLVLYHVSLDSVIFNRFAKKASWIITSKDSQGYDYYPSPVFISDLASPRHIERIWSRERLVSKRGCIGIVGLNIEEELRQKLISALNLLIEDLDLNIILISILKDELIKDILLGIKFSANTRYIASEKYSSKELLGVISRIDILITSDIKGVICGMAVNKPFVGLTSDDELEQFLSGMTEEEIIFDIERLSSDELYSKIKIAWVHRDSIAKQMQDRVAELKKKAVEGIRRLGKEFIE